MNEAPAQESPAPRPRSAKVFMIVMTIVWLLALLPAGAFALMSPFAFDQGSSDAAWRVFWGLILAPFVLLGTLLFAWVLFAARLIRPAMLAMFLPLLYFAIFLLIT